jgi:hypothetical protein
MCRVHERQRDEWAAVFRPAGDDWQPIEAHIRRHMLGHRTAAHATRADFQQLDADVSRGPQLSRRRRQQRFGELHDTSDEPQRPFAERELGATCGPEQIGDQSERRALHVGEEQRRSAGGDHTPMDLGNFEVGIDGSVHRNDIVVTAESLDERAEIGKRAHLGLAICAL